MTVTSDRCDYCNEPLDNLAVCPRCGRCVNCGAWSPDPHSQNCLACGNTIAGRSDDTDVVFHVEVAD